MKPPKYNPGQWVVFKMESGQAFGQIKGGNFTSDGGWLYYVDNALTAGAVFTVAEVDITAKSDGAAWSAVS